MKKILFALASLALLAEPAAAVPMSPLQNTTVAPPQVEKVVYVGTRGSARRTVRRAVRRRTY